MDWYYPVLTGAVLGDAGRERLAHRRDAFVMEGWGVRCVSDRPWITAAETCECAMAHLAVGEDDWARQLFGWSQRLRSEDDRYWTGIVVPEEVHFPGGEQSTYTASAIILAADALGAKSAPPTCSPTPRRCRRWVTSTPRTQNSTTRTTATDPSPASDQRCATCSTGTATARLSPMTALFPMTASRAAGALRSPARWIVAGLVVLGLGMAMLAGSAAPVAAQAGATTSTLPTGGELGHIVPKPNTGGNPRTPATRAARNRWPCSSCCASSSSPWRVSWWRSRVARQRREAAGLDPVTVAHGGDVRSPAHPATIQLAPKPPAPTRPETHRPERVRQTVRRSTRRDPVADSSSKRPDFSAGR